MRPDMFPEDLAKASRAFRRRIARVGLAHLHEVDRRTASILARNEILPASDRPNDADAREVAEVVANVSHPKRMPLLLGPLVMRAKSEATRDAIPVAVLLLANDPTTRRAALAHFEQVLESSEPWLTPRTLAFLAKHRSGLLSDEPDHWQPAALQLHDAIRNDWLCNLRGFAQCAELRYDEGFQEYAVAVLRPSPGSVDSIEMAVWNPAAQREKGEAVVAECVASGSDLRDTLQSYYGKLGHVPLTGGLGMGQVVRRWLEANQGAVGVESRIWAWAGSCSSPLAKYHACAALLRNADLLTAESWSRLGEEIAIIVGNREVDGDENLSASAQAWALRCELAHHYSYHFGTRLPGAESERIAGLSWWMAERVALLLGTAEEDIRDFREKTVRYELTLSDRIGLLARPRLAPSTLWNATTALPSMWELSLLAELRHALPLLSPDQLSEPVRKRLERALRESLVGTFRSPDLKEEDVAYAFDATPFSTATMWLEALPEGDSRPALEGFLSTVEQIASSEKLLDVLNRLPELTPADQLFAAHVLGLWARVGRAPEDRLWELLQDAKWTTAVLAGLDEASLDRLYASLREIMLLRGGKWAWSLPHLFARGCEQVESADRRELLFSMVILASLDSGTVSAVQRLLHGKLRGELEPNVRYWRDRFREVWRLAPPVVTGKWRAMMAVLPVPNFPTAVDRAKSVDAG